MGQDGSPAQGAVASMENDCESCILFSQVEPHRLYLPRPQMDPRAQSTTRALAQVGRRQLSRCGEPGFTLLCIERRSALTAGYHFIDQRTTLDAVSIAPGINGMTLEDVHRKSHVHRVEEIRNGDGGQNTDDGNNDHQLDQRKTFFVVFEFA